MTEAASGYLIELRVNNVAQLLHTLDPFPFRGRDLDKEAEEFIVGWARELIICLVSANVAGAYLIDSPFRRLVEESFFILGWVANCRHLITFLIGCRSPGVRELYQRLSTAMVELKSFPSPKSSRKGKPECRRTRLEEALATNLMHLNEL